MVNALSWEVIQLSLVDLMGTLKTGNDSTDSKGSESRDGDGVVRCAFEVSAHKDLEKELGEGWTVFMSLAKWNSPW